VKPTSRRFGEGSEYGRLDKKKKSDRGGTSQRHGATERRVPVKIRAGKERRSLKWLCDGVAGEKGVKLHWGTAARLSGRLGTEPSATRT